MRNLINVQDFDEKGVLKLIEEEEYKTRNPIDIVDDIKKFHLKQLSKKSKLNTIFGTSSTIVTLIILSIGAIILHRFCMKKYSRAQNHVSHFNRISEWVIFHENPVSSRQIVMGETPSVTRKLKQLMIPL